jgi:hypothetical protein
MKRYCHFIKFNSLSCGVSAPKLTDNKPLYEVLTQQSNGANSFFEILSEPNEIKNVANDEKKQNKSN